MADEYTAAALYGINNFNKGVKRVKAELKLTKLIADLDEYMDYGEDWGYACESPDEDFVKFFHTADGKYSLDVEKVIAKRFGFVERLIVQDLLRDYIAVYSPLDGRHICMGDYVIPTINDSLLDSITAYLAVQEDPIEVLANMLA